MSALDEQANIHDIDCPDWTGLGKCVCKSGVAVEELAQLRSENADLLKKVDEAIAWHESDCSPHALLEHELARLQKAVEEAEEVIKIFSHFSGHVDTCETWLKEYGSKETI